MKRSGSTGPSCALVLILAACGGQGGSPSAEEAVRGLLDAARAGDVAKARTYMPTREQLARVLDCPSGSETLERVERARADLDQEIVELASLRLHARDTSRDAVERVAIGQAIQGCKAVAPFELHKLGVTFEGKGGKLERDTMRLITFEGRYYLVNI